jgi:hypothetical protein
MFDWVMPLNRPRPFIFIGWGGLAPVGVEGLTNLVLKYNSNSVYNAQTKLNRLDPRSNRPGDVEIFRKPYISHPDSELTFYIWILIYSTRPIQWGSPNYLLRTLARAV